MSGFWYVANEGSNADRFRNWIGLFGDDRQSFVDLITLPAGQPEESYPEQTGAGFRPEAVLLVAHHPGNGVAQSNDFFIGGAARGKQFGMRVFHPYLQGGGNRISWLSDRQILPGLGEFSDFTNDGFLFNLPNPLPWSLPLTYIAMAGGGGYDCGVALSPTSPGVQQITGLPFQPSCVLFVTSQVTDLTELGQPNTRVMIGAADDRGESYSTWCGSLAHDIYVNQTCSPQAISMNRDANNFVPIPFVTDYHPEQSNVAEVTDFLSNGFELTWSKIEGGTARYFAWMAFQKAATGRWTYHHVSGQQAFITTPYKPHGLIMWGNQIAHEEMTEYNPPTNGSSIGMGFCDSALSQFHFSFSDVDAPPFRFTQTAGNKAATAMGCMPRQSGGLVHDFTDDRVLVIEMEGQDLAPIVGMNYRYAARRGHRGRMLHSFD